MRTGSNLSPSSSSIGARVRSKKNRATADPPESTDSSDFSLDLTALVENPGQAIVGRASPVAEMERLTPVGPLSTIGGEKVESWRQSFGLSNEVAIRIPGPIDRVSEFEVDEVPVYDGFFESGFRDRVPSLAEAFGISPGQLNPPSWRTLIAMQNLGDLDGLTIGVAEVLHSYFVSSIIPERGGIICVLVVRFLQFRKFPKGRERGILSSRVIGFDVCWWVISGFSLIWRAAGGSREFRGQSYSPGWQVAPPGAEKLARWTSMASPARQAGKLHLPEPSNSPVGRAGPVLLARLASCTSRSRATRPLGEQGQSCSPGWRVTPPGVEQLARWESRASPARQVGELHLPEWSNSPIGRAGPVLLARLASFTSRSRATRPLGEQGHSCSPGWRVGPPGVEQLALWASRASPARQVGELHLLETSNSPIGRAEPVLLARLASCTSRSRETRPLGKHGQSCLPGWRVAPPGVEQLARWASRASPAGQVGELHLPESSNSPVGRAGPVLLARLASCLSWRHPIRPFG
ncbi:hypothetical protein Bca101_025816 [Brassica carinata]